MEVKIKLSSKRLSSGRCQVQFQVSGHKDNAQWYGYTLAEPNDTLREVVGRIESRFRQADDSLSLFQKVLYNMKGTRKQQESIMIFRKS